MYSIKNNAFYLTAQDIPNMW